MKTAILFYSFGGATRKEAARLAAELGADVLEVREARRRGLLSSFLTGCPAAMKRAAVPIVAPDADLSQYERIIVGCPVWAGFPAPAFNSIVALLPAGKTVEVFLCSGGGETPKSAAGTRALIEAHGCKVAAYRDVATGKKPAKEN